jgi:hypothetical protein
MTRHPRHGFQRLGAVRLFLAVMAVCALFVHTMAPVQAGEPGGVICRLHTPDGSAPHRDQALCHDHCLLCAGHVLALGGPPPPMLARLDQHGIPLSPPITAEPFRGGGRLASYISRAPPQAA